MASKFIFAIGRKHLFNPAAFGVVLPAFLLDHPATWWVGGNLPLLPLVLIGGVLIVRKLHRFDLVATFILVDLVTVLATTAPADYGMALSQTLLSSPIFFFAFVMLTEPLTAPTMPLPSIAFGAIVGFLFAPNVHIGSFYFTPELALLIGNLFAYIVGPKGRFLLTLERIEQSAADTYDFIFRPSRKPAFQAGQYLEWTLGVERPDNRGNRRYFTVASAPSEDSVRLGVKFYPGSSAFKRMLGAMAPGDTIYAAQLAGSFTLPADPKKKLAFLAGGIGITPFRSMLQHLLDRREARPIVVLYGNETQDDIAYRPVLDAADRELGIRTVYAVARGAARHQYPGFIDANLVRRAIPDYRDRTFYISGPRAMVKTLRAMLRSMGVRRSRIKVDFFPGFG
jgi:ferredoxin-NADP reductase